MSRLEVIHIRTALVGARLLLVRHKLSKLALHTQCGWLRGIDRRNLVEKIGEPHEPGVISEIQPPYSVIDHLIADVHLFGESFFREVHYRGSDIEIIVETIIEVKPKKSLTLSAEQ